MNFWDDILEKKTQFNFIKKGNKLLFPFSSGQDSFFCNLHLIKQKKIFVIGVYQIHEVQSSNFYIEYHSFKNFYHFSTPILINLFLMSNKSEAKLKELRYDLFFREMVFYNLNGLIISHSQTDLIETKLLEFSQKSSITFFEKKAFSIQLNYLLLNWPKKIFLKDFVNHDYVSTIDKPKMERFFLRMKKNSIIEQVNFFLFTKKEKKKFLQFDNFLFKKKSLFSNSIFKVYRPLTILPRVRIFLIQKKLKLPVQNDHSNFCLKYAHNSIRHKYLPLWKLIIGNDFEKSFFNSFFKEMEAFSLPFDFFSILIYSYNGIIIFHRKRIFQKSEYSSKLITQQINYIARIHFSDKEFSILKNNVFRNRVLFLRIRFPQILIFNEFFIFRFY